MAASSRDDSRTLRQRPKSGARSAFAWGLSLAIHLATFAIVGEWALGALGKSHASVRDDARASAERLVAVELPSLPSMTEASLLSPAPRDPVGAVPVVAGGPTIPRIDTGRNGVGGERTVDQAATHLSDTDERLRLSQGTLNRLDRDQVQRVRSQATRASWEDRRATTHPMDLAFLSSGDLSRLERRPLSDRDPSRGALVSPAPSLPGGAPGSVTASNPVEQGSRETAVAQHTGSAQASPGQGVRDGAPGMRHLTAAAAARARPEVALAPVSVEAPVKARPRDDVDSEQELASKVAALVHASTAGGIAAKEGVGGSFGGGVAGAAGVSGPGSHPTPLGDRNGDWFDLSSSDPRIITYFRRFHAKVDPLWVDAFPRSAMLELKQGTVILEVTISTDGTARVGWPPVRPSGVPEFDRNCAEAVRRASPFDPIPTALGLTELHLRVPFVARNPIVH